MSNYSQRVYGRDYVQVSSDAFARTSLVRRIVEPYGAQNCDWCGYLNRYGKLFEYGTDHSGWRVDWHRGLFCCKACHDIYHS